MASIVDAFLLKAYNVDCTRAAKRIVTIAAAAHTGGTPVLSPLEAAVVHISTPGPHPVRVSASS